MSDGDRHGYITFGWIATICYLLLFGAIHESNNGRVDQSTYYKQKCGSQYPDSPFATAYPVTEAHQAEKAEGNEKLGSVPDWCDLAAQQSMAEDTASMRVVAWFGFFSGMAGISLLIWTLHETRKSANTAEAQFGAAKETSKLELRAYLAVEPDGINQLIGRMEVMGHVRLRNVGRLPARNVSLIVKMEISAGPEEDPLSRRKDFAFTEPSTYSERVINPGGDMVQGSKDVLAIGKLAVDHHNVYVFGVARYDNGYGAPCFTRFCHRYSTDGRVHGLEREQPPEKSRAAIEVAKARYHNYGNDAN